MKQFNWLRLCFCVLIFISLASTVHGDEKNILDAAIPEAIASEPEATQIVKQVRRCATAAPDSLRRAALRLRIASVRAANLDALRTTEITIPVCFHVIHKGDVGKVTDERIQKQIDVLNADFNPHGFKFTLKSIDRLDVADPTINKPEWFKMSFNSASELAAKTKLGVEPEKNLNFYTAEPTDSVLGGLLGFATFPWDLAADPRRDGVVVVHSSLPEGAAPFNLGKTATHEVGHWLGLFHTFQGGCQSPGDEVDDTPAQKDGNNIFECDDLLDTCNAAGKDPVHNYMNYADDVCLKEFTAGQTARMKIQVGSFRSQLTPSPARAMLKMID